MEQYEQVRCIGYGSVGRVILAKEKNSKMMYAIKISNTPIHLDSKHEAIAGEVSFLQQFHHPNVVSIKESFIESTYLHLVLEYVPLGNLHQFLSFFQESKEFLSFSITNRIIPECIIKHILCDCLKGLDAIHSNHVIHRDIKPENCLIDKAGVVKVCDFTASIKHDHQIHQTCIGTIQYMAPEVLRSKPVTYAADIWSLGCVMYELMCRQPLFPNCSFDAMIGAVFEQWDGVVSLPSFYSEELKAIIQQMIVLDPLKRPSARSLLQREFFRDDSGKIVTQSFAERALIHFELKNALHEESVKKGTCATFKRLQFDSDFLIQNGQSLFAVYDILSKYNTC